MSFPEQLKKARLKMGYTQQQVAEAMGITNSTYCGYETGKRQPDVQKIKALAKLLCVSGDELLETGFEPNSLKKEETPSLYLSEDVSKKLEKLLYLVESLSNENWERLLDYANLLEGSQPIAKDGK